MTRLLGLRNSPTAVLASNGLTASGALRAVRYNRLRVPYDISIVGFDDIDLSQFMQPPLTTIRLSRVELGEKAFHPLYRVLHGDSRKGEEYPVETHLVVRQSTGEVPRHR
jgi:DNA-binding LacI/PurR family transcriptional regulator